jgi:predicted permease
MTLLRLALARIRALFRRDAVADEIREEMQFHLDERASDLRDRGLPSDEAASAAKRKFGNVAVMADRGYDVRGAGLVETGSFEVRHAIRTLWHHRGTSAFAFAIMTITMAAATVTFSIVDGVALRPLPYGQPDRLVSLTAPSPVVGRFYPASPHDYFAWLDGTQSFEGLAAARFVAAREFEQDGRAYSLVTRGITTNLFDVLRVRPALGRFFDPEHERPGGPDDVIVSHGFWTRHLDGAPDALGRVLTFGAERRRIIGVLPDGVGYPIMIASEADLYVPYVATPDERAGNGPRLGTIQVVGRLRAGVTLEQARADANRVSSAVVVPLHDQVVGPAQTWLMLILAAAGLVVFAACVNVASLLMARATTRARELATREALGASRRRLAAGLLLEGLLLSFVSAAAAVVIAASLVNAAKIVLPPDLTRIQDIGIDGRVLTAVMAVSVLCGLVFSTAPVWRTARTSLLALIQTNGGSVIGGRRRQRGLSTFLVANVALVCALLVATVLVVGTFIRIETADLGFDRQNLIRVDYLRPIDDVPVGERPAVLRSIRLDMLERARAVRGVSAVALVVGGGPLSRSFSGTSITLPERGEVPRDASPDSLVVSPAYLDVLGMKMLKGRWFDEWDTAEAPSVVVINDAASRRYFPGAEAVGQTIGIRSPKTIVGVIADTPTYGPEVEVRPQVYLPLDQDPWSPITRSATAFGGLMIRTSTDSREVAAAVEEELRAWVPGATVRSSLRVDDWHQITAARRFNAAVMGTFGLVAILIAALGIFGTMAFVVAQQTRAIGLRTALGASRGHIMRGVLLTALRFVAIGTTIGLTAAWLGSELMVSFVFGIEPTAPSVYAGVAAFLVLVALVAAWIPARRAANVDPVVALRAE